MNVVAHRNAQNFVSYGTGELVTIMEPMSFTGVAGNSLFIYRGKHIMSHGFYQMATSQLTQRYQKRLY